MFSIKKLKARSKPKQDKQAPDRINKAILAAQRRAADYLNGKTARWSPNKTKVLLVLFCLVMGSASLFVAVKAILSGNGPPSVPKVIVPSKIDSIIQPISNNKNQNR